MSLNLAEEEIHCLTAYARGKFAAEPYPFAPALRAIRESLAKLDRKPIPTPLPPRRPYVPGVVPDEKEQAEAVRAARAMSSRGSITLSELVGKLDLLEIKCHRCDRHGRVSLAGLIENHGADTGLPDLRETLAGDCPNAANSAK